MKIPLKKLTLSLIFTLAFASCADTKTELSWTLPSYSEYPLALATMWLTNAAGASAKEWVRNRILPEPGTWKDTLKNVILYPIEKFSPEIIKKDSWLRSDAFTTTVSWLPATAVAYAIWTRVYARTPRGLYAIAKNACEKCATAALAQYNLNNPDHTILETIRQYMIDSDIRKVNTLVNEFGNAHEQEIQSNLIELCKYLEQLEKSLLNARAKLNAVIDSNFASAALKKQATILKESIRILRDTVLANTNTIKNTNEYKTAHAQWCAERGVTAQEISSGALNGLKNVEQMRFGEEIARRYFGGMARVAGWVVNILFPRA